MAETYYGNEKGAVLGPYEETEIQPRLLAIEMLRGESRYDVYAVPARSIEDAKAKLLSARQREAEQELEA